MQNTKNQLICFSLDPVRIFENKFLLSILNEPKVYDAISYVFIGFSSAFIHFLLLDDRGKKSYSCDAYLPPMVTQSIVQ